METRDRQGEILLMLFAVQITGLVVIFPDLVPLLLVALLLVLKVVYDEFVVLFAEHTWGR